LEGKVQKGGEEVQARGGRKLHSDRKRPHCLWLEDLELKHEEEGGQKRERKNCFPEKAGGGWRWSLRSHLDSKEQIEGENQGTITQGKERINGKGENRGITVNERENKNASKRRLSFRSKENSCFYQR